MLKCDEGDVNLFIILGVTVSIWKSPGAGWWTASWDQARCSTVKPPSS